MSSGVYGSYISQDVWVRKIEDYAGFLAKKLVNFVILDVSVLRSFCTPREACVSAFRFLPPSPPFAFDVLDFDVALDLVVVVLAGMSWARMERTYLFRAEKLEKCYALSVVNRYNAYS